MPKTTLNWKKPTSRPRHFAGEISAMYIGPSTDEPPIPRPPMNRKSTSADQPQAKAQPKAEIKYNTAITRRLSRRPYRSPGIPASIAPKTVPQSALATVIPKEAGERRYVRVRACVVPAITAVSNPNNKPPKAATTVLLIKYVLSFIGLPNHSGGKEIIQRLPLYHDVHSPACQSNPHPSPPVQRQLSSSFTSRHVTQMLLNLTQVSKNNGICYNRAVPCKSDCGEGCLSASGQGV